MPAACWAPLPMRFPRQECWSGLSFPPPGNLSDPRIETIHRECDVIERAADTVICAMQRSPSGREDFEHARAGVEHCAGMIVCIVPRANRFHTQQVTVKMHRIIKMFFVYAFEREVVKSVCFAFHNSLLLCAKIWFFQSRQIIGFIVPQM